MAYHGIGWGDVNLSRFRHAKQIKYTVYVETILADTIPMASDDMVINSARAAVADHGAGIVKLIATKIDVSLWHSRCLLLR